MIHTMIDIESLSTSNTPVLLEIGAVKFNADEVLDRIQIGIDPADCERYGLKCDAATVMYWMQDKMADARKAQNELGRVDLFAALDGFAGWVNQTPEEERGSAWGKGATFDNVKLKAAYDAVGLTYPFTYKQDECYRTFANRFPDVEYVQVGTAHSGVQDAESQAIHLITICKAHGVKL
jgi:hypothetical protein